MKTTLDIDDELLVKAKLVSARASVGEIAAATCLALPLFAMGADRTSDISSR
jgi:hypothetical protein